MTISLRTLYGERKNCAVWNAYRKKREAYKSPFLKVFASASSDIYVNYILPYTSSKNYRKRFLNLCEEREWVFKVGKKVGRGQKP